MFDTCIILAGGRGTHLRPLTDELPKPMVEVNGQPFIMYIIEHLRSHGVANIIILTGYRGESFYDVWKHYESMPSFNLTLLRTPEKYETSQRIKEAKSYIQGNVLICYGDVYSDIDITTYYNFFLQQNYGVTVSVSAISRHVSGNQGSRYSFITPADITYKDIGYLALHANSLNTLVDESPALKVEDIIRDNSKDHKIYSDRWAYCSLTDINSLREFEQQLTQRATIFIDRDGVLTTSNSKGKYLESLEDLHIISESIEAIKSASRMIEKIVIVTNQPWIGLDPEKMNTHDQIQGQIMSYISTLGIKVSSKTCAHKIEERCFCRKPKPGMILEHIMDYPTLRRKVLIIGDSIHDAQLSRGLGDISFIGVDYKRNPLTKARLADALAPKICADHWYYGLCGLPHGRFDT